MQESHFRPLGQTLNAVLYICSSSNIDFVSSHISIIAVKLGIVLPRRTIVRIPVLCARLCPSLFDSATSTERIFTMIDFPSSLDPHLHLLLALGQAVVILPDLQAMLEDLYQPGTSEAAAETQQKSSCLKLCPARPA